MRNIVKQSFMYLAFAMAVAACGDSAQSSSRGSAVTQPDVGDESGPTNTSPSAGSTASNGGSGGAGGQASTAPLTDPQILEVLAAVNAGEIEQNTFAATRAKTPEVLSTAKSYAAAHTEALAKLEEVAADEQIAPEESPISKQLKSASKHTLGQLKSASADEFDTVYVQSQIKVHDKVLALIDKQLLPAVRNPALRTETERNRETVAGHLEHARSLAKSQSLDVDAGLPDDAGL